MLLSARSIGENITVYRSQVPTVSGSSTTTVNKYRVNSILSSLEEASVEQVATAALFLSHLNAHIVVLESCPGRMSIEGGIVMLEPNGMHVFQGLGLAEALHHRPNGTQVPWFYMCESSGGVSGKVPQGSAKRYGFASTRVTRWDIQEVLLDVTKRKRLTIAWNAKIEDAEELSDGVVARWREGSADKERKVLRRYFDWAFSVPQIINAAEVFDAAPFVWPVYEVKNIQNWCSKSIVLVGDAAHAMPPHSCQGASQGLEYAAYLAYLLRQHQLNPSSDLKDVLTQLQRDRQPRVNDIAAEANCRGDQKWEISAFGMFVKKWGMRVVLLREGELDGWMVWVQSAWNRRLGQDYTRERVDPVDLTSDSPYVHGGVCVCIALNARSYHWAIQVQIQRLTQ
ncbi:uncharacterized protein EDB91DRAFT_1242253 [Suillus paluster]|uniref:uncharacterized protein n=1 Tax=Suillus paluster TaxID=48578 RepID=UPI001B886676|nr:uncharacterized protein EDB91DRAFT_1242253 [Suillus paluster]KAG1755047.1 hypothetical protein EDB91DRAFT_1242253 [Suillus paluster]